MDSGSLGIYEFEFKGIFLNLFFNYRVGLYINVRLSLSTTIFFFKKWIEQK
jgi:hypothetical protein